MIRNLANKVTAATKVPSFQGLLDAAITVANERIAGRDKAQAIMNVVQAAEAEQRRALTRINKCLYFAGWDSNPSPMEWQPCDYGVEAVVKHEKLETPDYIFDIILQKTDLKRTPWEVKARLCKIELSINPQEVHGGYRMDDYGKEKYGGEDMLTSRHKTLVEAEAEIEGWKERLYKDHAAEIDFCRYLRKLAIAGGAQFVENDNLIPWTSRG